MADSCGTCFFFVDGAFCQRNAPVFTLGQSGQSGQWPVVLDTNWCGEFAQTDPDIYLGVPGISAPWVAYTPAVRSASGVITLADSAVGRYLQIGKTWLIEASIHISVNGTGADYVYIGLPITVTVPAAGLGLICPVAIYDHGGAVYTSGTGVTSDTANEVRCFKYDGTYPGADDTYISLTGVFESI